MAKDSHDTVTKNQPGHPEDVGKSTARRGEDVGKEEGKEAGRHDTEKKGDSGRPTGTSTPRDWTGVDPKKPKT